MSCLDCTKIRLKIESHILVVSLDTEDYVLRAGKSDLENEGMHTGCQVCDVVIVS